MKSVILLNRDLNHQWVTHTFVRKTYVFEEETIHHKDGGTSRFNGGTSRFNPVMCGQISKYEDSDEDTMLLSQLRSGG